MIRTLGLSRLLPRWRVSPRGIWWWAGLMMALALARIRAADATFFRGVNLNGPPVVIDGRTWEGSNAVQVVIRGKTFENQAVPLKPATDPVRARMIRSSVWGSSVDVELTEVPSGDYQVLLYVWEDNHSEQFDLRVNDRVVMESFHSGAAGAWKKLGPWPVQVRDGRLKVSARGPFHGAANLSGLEIWAGRGVIPAPVRRPFLTELTPAHGEFFERKIRPLLAEHCYECHSATAKRVRGGLLLDSRAGVIQGGDTGPAIAPGEPEASLLLQAIRHLDPDLSMPPNRKLSDGEIADVEEWIRQGAPDPRVENAAAQSSAKPVVDWEQARHWWSLRPVIAPPVPRVQQRDWPQNDLDRFILARLETAGLTPAEDAERRVLLRRVTYDLTGLPPTPGELQGFLQDESPGALARVVDRLLASPHYGERWGRYWLDVVRYADTAGDNSDFPVPQLYRYRDWVIEAFNRDLPYGDFIRQQIAGDLLPTGDPLEAQRRLIATGYIANARRFGSRVEDYPQHLTIEDTLDNLGRAFLGLTINCARCHDHKFDPITAADYYALYGIFQSTRYPWPGIELEQRQRDLVPLVAPERREAALAAQRAFDEERQRRVKVVQQLKEALKTIPADGKAAQEARIQDAEAAVRTQGDQEPRIEMAYAVADAKRTGDATLQVKGDPAKPGAVVPRRFLTVLGGAELPAGQTNSGRRELADWIADPANPLPARVMVNRIWQYHFGRGLVATPNDFGHQGRAPSHPELLDWLAVRFRESGGSVKAMHRLILLSHTYRLSSRRDDSQLARDPNNALLGAFPLRRLDAEAIRDTLLTLGGNLVHGPSGPHPFPPQSQWKFTQHNPFKAVYESRHRSVYLMIQRIQRHPFLAIFDGADPAASTPARTSSTTPLQALYFLNDAFVHEQSVRFAGQLVTAARGDRARLELACERALGRPASAEERIRTEAFLKELRGHGTLSGKSPAEVELAAWSAVVRVLLRLNEFVYID